MTGRAGLDLNLMVAMFGDPEGWCGISGSSAGAVGECPARLALPQVRRTGEAAERGNALHIYARLISINPEARAEALLEVDEEWRLTAEGMDISGALYGLEPVGYERAFALNVKTRKVRLIGDNIGRDYEGALARAGQPKLSRYEIPFTIDVVAFWNGVPVELDYKSGQSIGDPAEHWQRRVCATGLMFFYDTPTAISRVAYIKDDGSIIPDGHEFSILDAEDYCDELVRAIDRVWEARLIFANGIMPTIYPSDSACAYCSAQLSCPEFTNFVKAMVGRLQAIEDGPELSAVSEAELLKAWSDLKKAEKIVEEELKKMKKLAKEKPFGEGDEVVAPQKPYFRSNFNSSKARGLITVLLQQAGADEDEIKAKLDSLVGKTEVVVVKKGKRHLPMVA